MKMKITTEQFKKIYELYKTVSNKDTLDNLVADAQLEIKSIEQLEDIAKFIVNELEREGTANERN